MAGESLSVVRSEPLPDLHVVNSAPLSSETSSSAIPVMLTAATAAVPKAAGWAMELATNPDAWKAGKVAGEVLGAVSGAGSAIAAGHPIAAPAAAAAGAWAGAKAGWRVTNLAQRLASPVAGALNTIAPYAEKALPYMNALSTAQAEGDVLKRLNTPEIQDAVSAKQQAVQGVTNEGIAKVFDKMGRADLAKLWRGEK